MTLAMVTEHNTKDVKKGQSLQLIFYQISQEMQEIGKVDLGGLEWERLGVSFVNKFSIVCTIMMQNGGLSQVDCVNPLIKLVRERQDLYFQLLGFVNTHLTSSSNDLDNTTVFNKFITLIDHKHQQLRIRETQFIATLLDPFAEGEEINDQPISKQMLRLSSRLLQILEASIERVRRSVFEDNGKAVKELARFKSSLNKIINQQFFIAKDFAELIVSYTSTKYNRQFLKLKKYVQKVKEGDDIWFKQLYYVNKSDHESSPSPDEKRKDPNKTVRKLYKKVDLQHLSSTEQPQKKPMSLKKTVKTAMKRRSSRTPAKENTELQSPTREKVGSKLYKFYSFLQLNKKQFLEDYAYDKAQMEKHKNELLNKLLERNKNINSQINFYVRKSSHCLPIPIPAKSSGDQRNESASSRVSLRTSFVISKRKSSFHFQTSTERQPSSQKKSDSHQQFDQTIKNLNPRRRSSHSNHRQPQQKSKKLFMVKAPMVFEEEIIPQAQITQTQWLQAPLTMKVREKRPDNIRLKRKNNVNPLENAFLSEHFRYPL